jgi:hypothetical protein
MNKEFIPYEQALELKELGFDKPCFKTMLDFDITYQSDIKMPLKQQAFRWFREKYNIQGYIYSSTVRGNSEKTKQFTGYIWNINGIDMPFISTDARDELHDTYEEAELACLNKLIEIVKL